MTLNQFLYIESEFAKAHVVNLPLYKAKTVNAIEGDNRCVLWASNKTQE